ncbi:zinc ribbon domain-containing protein [Vannielia sp.]|uniref:Zn-ribbon domain-containing OB-fold protein n=1 Tax=Vannielia sp. TaxID=2813045 RepID=UPI00262C12FC|nr:zinc ribbon domain-containing protein [Vannielia sp.]MDF1872835.1 zinc ribbon domain-containing protein [Vannielia sp.]
MQATSGKPNKIRWYYEGLSKGVFRASKCSDCGKFTFPPTGCCEHCGSWNVEDAELSGKGTLLFATHSGSDASHPRFEKAAPFVYGHIRLEEGPIAQAIIQGAEPTPEDLKALYEKGPVPVQAVTLQMDDLPVIAFKLQD